MLCCAVPRSPREPALAKAALDEAIAELDASREEPHRDRSNAMTERQVGIVGADAQGAKLKGRRRRR